MSNKSKNTGMSKREKNRHMRNLALLRLSKPTTYTPEVREDIDIIMQEIIDLESDVIHVDDFIDNRFLLEENRCEHTDYARWMFNYWRLPAMLVADFAEFMEEHKLFCIYNGEKHRVTGCSRLGDVWLTLNFDQSTGYQKRVRIEDCLEWSKD